MPKSHPHRKRGGGEPAPEPAMPDSVDVAASDLRAQVALLADQVRRLGDRADSHPAPDRSGVARMDSGFAELGDLLVPAPRPPRRSWGPEQQPPPASPAAHTEQPPSEPALQTPVAAADGEGASGGGGTSGGGGASDTFADRSSRLVASVVALAELAAIEIRTGAEIEAAAIRAQSRARLNEPSTSHLLVLLERQRHMIEALTAQSERLERGSAVLRAQIRALEAEREHIAEVLGTARQTP